MTGELAIGHWLFSSLTFSIVLGIKKQRSIVVGIRRADGMEPYLEKPLEEQGG